MDRSWGGFLLQVLAGILYCIGGLLIMREPVAGSVVITLVLAIVMIVADCRSPELALPITATGAIERRAGVRLVDAARKRVPITVSGWQHF